MLPAPFKKVLQLVGQTYLVTIVGLIIGIFSARGLEVEDRGLLALALLLIQLSSRVGSIGFEQLVHEYGNSVNIKSLYCAGALGGFIALPATFALLSNSAISPFLLFASPILAGLVAAMRINIALLIHHEEIKKLTFFNLSQSLGQLLLYALAFLTHEVNFFFAAWATNILLFSAYSFSFIQSYKSNAGGVTMVSILKSWRMGGKYTGMIVPEMALFFCLELPVVKVVLNSYSAGLYSISNTITSIYYQLFVAITSIFIKSRASFKRSSVYIALALACSILWFIAPYFIEVLFGRRYLESVHFLNFMLPATYLVGISRVEYMMADNKQVIQQVLPSITLVIMLLCGFLASPENLLWWIFSCYLIFALLTILLSWRGVRRGNVA